MKPKRRWLRPRPGAAKAASGKRNREGTGVFELDDAKCKDGAAYDLKFDKDYKLWAIIRD